MEWLDRKGDLEKTIITLYSDHGDHMFYPFIKFESGSNETFNPFLFFIIPTKFSTMPIQNSGQQTDPNNIETVHDILEANKDKLVTHFDLFTTWYTYLGYSE